MSDVKNRLIESYHIIQNINPRVEYEDGSAADILLGETRTFANLVYVNDERAGQMILDYTNSFEQKFTQLLERHPEKVTGDAISKKFIRDDFEGEATELLKDDICKMLRYMINNYDIL